MSPRTGAGRLLRVGAFAGAAVALAGGAHVAGGGVAPGGVALALGAIVAALVSLGLTARRRGPVAIAVTLAATQAALHTLFALVPAPGTIAAAGGAHVHHLSPVSAAGHVHALAPLTAADARMLVAHAAATLATAAVLAYGEACLWGVWRLAAACAPRLGLAAALTRLLGVARPAPAPADVPVRPLAGLLRSSAVGLRGPPALPSI